MYTHLKELRESLTSPMEALTEGPRKKRPPLPPTEEPPIPPAEEPPPPPMFGNSFERHSYAFNVMKKMANLRLVVSSTAKIESLSDEQIKELENHLDAIRALFKG